MANHQHHWGFGNALRTAPISGSILETLPPHYICCNHTLLYIYHFMLLESYGSWCKGGARALGARGPEFNAHPRQFCSKIFQCFQTNLQTFEGATSLINFVVLLQPSKMYSNVVYIGEKTFFPMFKNVLLPSG